MAEKPQQKSWLIRIPTHWVLVGALMLSLAYSGAYFFFALHTKMCAPPSELIGPVAPSFLRCLSLNELGDALGGAVGPLAFLFLASALLVQAMELAAQRWELDQTQAVMREQLEVARQQVAETRASTALFKEQTSILKREQELRERKEADAELHEILEQLKGKLRTSGNQAVFAPKSSRHGAPTLQSEFLYDAEVLSQPNWLQQIQVNLTKWSAMTSPEREKPVEIVTLPQDALHALYNYLVKAMHKRDRLSTSVGLKADSIAELGIPDLINKIWSNATELAAEH